MRELLSFLSLVDIQAHGMALEAFDTDARVERGSTLGIVIIDSKQSRTKSSVYPREYFRSGEYIERKKEIKRRGEVTK
jgi:hypothetical protein